jgi:hypothetical protein
MKMEGHGKQEKRMNENEQFSGAELFRFSIRNDTKKYTYHTHKHKMETPYSENANSYSSDTGVRAKAESIGIDVCWFAGC